MVGELHEREEGYTVSVFILCCITIMMLFLAQWCEGYSILKSVVETGGLDEVIKMVALWVYTLFVPSDPLRRKG